jgi:hypothetical protein
MTRRFIPLALVCPPLIASLGCSPTPSAHVPQPRTLHLVTSGLALTTSIASDKSRLPALRINLKNVAGTSIRVETGQASYPAANFTFQITLQDRRRFDLLCDLCGNVGIAPGHPVNYWVELPPGKTWVFDLPLRGFLYVDSGDQRLDNIAARQATITTSLRGTKPREDIDPADGKAVWAGTASAQVSLPAFSRRVQQWLASGGVYASRSYVRLPDHKATDKALHPNVTGHCKVTINCEFNTPASTSFFSDPIYEHLFTDLAS